MKLFIVDAFTDQAFRGNPAAIVLMDEPRSAEWMQNVAMEMKHSETAFVDATTDVDGTRGLRWFTPLVEVDLVGHATLAATHVLGGSQSFRTRSGVLHCDVQEDNSVQLDLPIDPVVYEPHSAGIVDGLLGDVTVLGVWADDVRTIVELQTDDVERCVPNVGEMLRRNRGRVHVTARGTGDIDFVSRYFAPAVGIPEDPVTGSAHCTLAPFWMERLGKKSFRAQQLSQRGGSLDVEINGDRVLLRGRATTVVEGELRT